MLFLPLVFNLSSQSCSFTLQGVVNDAFTNQPLQNVSVVVQESGATSLTDHMGKFQFDSLCPGHFHLHFSHIGCEAELLHLDLISDSSIAFSLNHFGHELGEVEIEGKNEFAQNQSKLSIGQEEILDRPQKELAELLKGETGVYSISSGGGISKPVVNGLWGNRLPVLNRGIAQAGQQWGSDHGPEIDPAIYDKVSVIKGLGLLEYVGNNLGAAVALESSAIGREPHHHGFINTGYSSNGRGRFISTRLQRYNRHLAWRFAGSYSGKGDHNSPDYFLTNTGSRKGAAALQLEKSWKEKIFLDVFLSSFYAELGVLRGSHIGNTSDLNQAIGRDVPFFTSPDFSYAIQAPKQEVAHHFFQAQSRLFLQNQSFFQVELAGQMNDRKEFDLRRGGRTETPSLSIQQGTLDFKLKFQKTFEQQLSLKMGNHSRIQQNRNDPETGILPLIPDFNSWANGTFVSARKMLPWGSYFGGLRYDHEYRNSIQITRDFPRTTQSFLKHYNGLSLMAGAMVKLRKGHNLLWNLGWGSRGPEVNELYSNGLHQGVAGIERGDPQLKNENGFKGMGEYTWTPGTHFSLSALAYFQHFENYIFLLPEQEWELTIRGAFPVFTYSQTRAQMYGLDFSTKFILGKTFSGNIKYSFLQGQELGAKQALLQMPPNRISFACIYESQNPIKISDRATLKGIEARISPTHVFKQKRVEEGRDYLAPPEAYSTLEFEAAANLVLSQFKWRLFLSIENLLNRSYRDYLSRLRFFADEKGRNVTLGLSLRF